VGKSAVTGDRRKAIVLGLDMIGLVLRTRLKSRKIRSRLGRPGPAINAASSNTEES
jgi:hypothetical protein